ncbi:MAG: dihydrodipicolinate synthase family protein, partial [bacterium]|nr:dihydrodipicolinate synthase family protein [bacterium]
VVGHLIGDQLIAMIDAFNSGDVKEAREIHLHFLELMTGIFMTVNPIPLKAALARLGLCEELYRLPMTQLDDKLSEQLDALLKEYELLPSRNGKFGAPTKVKRPGA